MSREVYYARRSRLARFARSVEPVYNLARGVYRTGAYLGKRQRASSAPRAPSAAPPKKGGKWKVAFSNGSGQSQKMPGNKGKKKTKAPLKKRVKQLEDKVNDNLATHVFKSEATFQSSAVSNRCGYNLGTLLGAAQFEQMLDAFPFQSTAIPGTPATFDATSVTQPAEWKIKCYTKTIMRNNYLYPCNIRCYILKPKVDTNTNPISSVTVGLTEQTSGAIYSTTAPFLYPSDSMEFNEHWKILSSCDMKLQSGDECVVPYEEEISYNQEFADSNTSTYLKKYSRLIFVRVVGVVCHDNATSTNVGISASAIDAVIERKFTVKYPSAAPIKTTEMVSGLSAITIGVVGVSSAETELAL